MNNSNQNSRPPSAVDDNAFGDDSAKLKARAAERRRDALRDFLRNHDLTASELARRIGTANANLIYNLQQGRSASLSIPVVERILGLFREVTFEELVGLPPRPLTRPSVRKDTGWPDHSVVVAMEAAAGTWVPSVNMAPERWELLPLSKRVLIAKPRGFGVLVGAPGAEKAYPTGSILLCRTQEYGETLEPGTRVVVQRQRSKLIEITIREVMISEGRTWLLSCSNKAEFQDALLVPNYRVEKRSSGSPDFKIEGVVIWALMPEPGIRPT